MSQRWTTGYVEQGLLQADGGGWLFAVTAYQGESFNGKNK